MPSCLTDQELADIRAHILACQKWVAARDALQAEYASADLFLVYRVADMGVHATYGPSQDAYRAQAARQDALVP